MVKYRREWYNRNTWREEFTENEKITVKYMVERIDWYTIVSFSWLKTCLLVWVPLHTLVFLMPVQYRVLASAFLSILLGILIAISKKGVNTEQA